MRRDFDVGNSGIAQRSFRNAKEQYLAKSWEKILFGDIFLTL